MNVLFTTNRFYPDIGGIESISDILTRYFACHGHSLRIVTQSESNYPNNEINFPFSVYRRPSLKTLLTCYAWADIVFQNNLEVRTLWPNFLFRKPVVIVLHTWLRSAAGRRTLINFIKLCLLRFTGTIVSVSNAIRRDSLMSSLVIGNPYNSQLFRIIPSVSKDNAICFLGRLVSDKGVDLLLIAYAGLRNPDWRLSIIGSGPERKYLVQLAQQLGIYNSVTFYGSLEGEQLVYTLNKHKIMVIPSRWEEPFGVVALEGLACGCVVVASDGGGLPEAIGSCGQLFKRGDAEDLKLKLKQLVDNNSLRTDLLERVPTHLKSFSEDFVCTRYIRLLESLA